MFRTLIIICISASLIASLVGGISKLAKQPDGRSETLYQLSEEISLLERGLQDVEKKVGEQPRIRSDIERLKDKINLRLEKFSYEQQWDWREDGLQPIILCLFLWLLLSNKKLFNEQGSEHQSTTRSESNSE